MIKSEAEYEDTLNMISELMESDPEPDSHHGKQLEKLCLLIREYEENAEPTSDMDMNKPHVISLGAGVQSSTMALMAAQGEINPMPDCAVFADTQVEPQSVYRWLDWLEKQLPFPVHRVTRGHLGEYATKVTLSKNNRYYSGGWPPVYAIGPSGKASPMMRQCTTDFKINPIQKFYRNHYKKQDIAQWIGISIDEAHRMKQSRNERIENRWPLIELGMKRHQCIQWMNDHGYPKPPRSACVFCPYQHDREWLRLKTEEPDDFAKAVEFEIKMQTTKSMVGFDGDVRLHKSMKWLSEVDFDPSKDQFDMFGNECEGMCGL